MRADNKGEGGMALLALASGGQDRRQRATIPAAGVAAPSCYDAVDTGDFGAVGGRGLEVGTAPGLYVVPISLGVVIACCPAGRHSVSARCSGR